jgi:integrase
LGEILTLKWSYVDLERRLLLLPDSKTGAKPIVLNEPSIEVLKSLPRLKNNPWVIAARKDGLHIYSLQDSWEAVRNKAGVPDVRIHDLRHSFASFAVLAGGTLPVLGSLLGHTSPATTARYVHLAKGPVAALAESTARAIAQAMEMQKA